MCVSDLIVCLVLRRSCHVSIFFLIRILVSAVLYEMTSVTFCTFCHPESCFAVVLHLKHNFLTDHMSRYMIL